jgi:hypothetical protein
MQFLRKLSRQYTPRVASVLGLDPTAPTSLSVGRLEGAAAEAYENGGITFDRRYLRSASKRDLRGALVHELAHVAGAASGTKHIEHAADAARAALVRDPNWEASAETRRYMEKRGIEMAGPGSNATGAGPNKNTLLNQMSKRTNVGKSGVPSPADPATYGGYATTIMGLQQQLAAAQALAKAGIGTAKAEFGMAKQAAKQFRVDSTAAVEGEMAGRGITGSSAAMNAQAGVVAETAAMRQAALAAKRSAVAGYRNDQIQAVGQFYTGLGAAQSELANAQAMQNIARYEADQFDVMNANFNKFRQQLLERMRHRTGTPSGAGRLPAPVGAAGVYDPAGYYGGGAPLNAPTVYTRGQR